MKHTEAIRALAALAQESRLAVFRLLVKRGPAGFSPSELLEQLAMPAPTLSFHLKELVHAGLINSRRAGRNVYYRPNLEQVGALMSFLTENCCSSAEEVPEDCAPVAPVTRARKRAELLR